MKASRKTVVFTTLVVIALMVSALSITAVSAQTSKPDPSSPASLAPGTVISNVAAKSVPFIAPYEGTDAVNSSLNAAKSYTQDSSNSPSSYFGKDNRKWVKYTTKYPYRTIAEVDSYFTTSGYHQCTATYVTDNVLTTEGWCVYDPFNSEWATDVYVYPAENGVAYNPYGYFHLTAPYSQYTTTVGWMAGNSNYDWGFIMDPGKGGYTVGWMGMSSFYSYTKPDIYKGTYILTGYPDDKFPNYLQWTSKGKIFASDSSYLYYGADEIDQFGSPLYAHLPTQWWVGCSCYRLAGIYEVGFHQSGGSTYNFAMRVTDAMISDVIGLWIP
jgi:glutamyl endopeptidase